MFRTKFKYFYNSIIFFSIYYFIKRFFSYNGKIFKLKLYKKKINFIVNRSHRVLLYFKNKIKIKKVSKKKYRVYFFYSYDTSILSNIFNLIRGLNVYT